MRKRIHLYTRPAMPLFLLAMWCTSFGVASGDEVSWIHGVAPPDTWHISPNSPLTTDVIHFCSPIREKEVYDNSCLAEQAMLGTLSLSTNPVTRDIVLCFEPPGPETCPSDPDPVCGLEGSFGPLQAGEWTFWIKFPGRIRFGSFQVGSVYYVDVDSSAGGAGTSWADAFRYLQDALMMASAGDEIRVAQGIYKPDQFVLSARPNMGREETFELINGVTLKGGYAGFGEPDPNARNVELYETVLSGDLNGNDIDVQDPCDLPNEPTRADNSYHVLIATTGQAQAVLDGFTITAGNANGEGYPLNQGSGGGIQIRPDATGEEGPVLTNCIFTRNSASSGGGMSNDHSSTTLTNCTFSENFANWGGGIGNEGFPPPKLVNCTFTANRAGYKGGAVANAESRPTLENCTIIANHAELGGAIYNGEAGAILTNCTVIGNSAERGGAVYNNDSSVTMTNCLVTRNWCSEKGGVVYLRSDDGATLTNCILTANSAQEGGVLYLGDEDGYAKLTNCTLTGNRASDNGGALYIDDPEEAIFTLTNCVLWSNTPQEIYPDPPWSEAVITHSDVQGIVPDGGNINADPCFADPGYWDLNGTPQDANDDVWVDGDYHLKSQAGRWDSNSGTWVIDDVTSPCIDAGDPLTPIMHEPFPNGGIINMGAYGGTAEASKSYFDKPPCETIVAGDINGDCLIDFRDFCIMALHWLEDNNK